MNKYITIVENGNTLNATYCDGKEMFSETMEIKKAFSNAAQSILQKVTGINAVSTKTVEPPTETKPETVKLYCIQSTPNPPFWKKGKVYECNDNVVKCEVGTSNLLNYPNRCTNYLVPLVSRPAKVGEWVYVLENALGTAESYIGKTVKAIDSDASGYAHFIPETEPNYRAPIDVGEYLVLDGFTPEEKPKYYNGEVICTWRKSENVYFTVGKKYSFVDGLVNCNGGGKPYNYGDPAKTKEEALNRSCVKFIPFIEG